RKPWRPRARRLPRARRQELDETHAVVDGREGQRDDRLSSGAQLHADQRRFLYRAEDARLLIPCRHRGRPGDLARVGKALFSQARWPGQARSMTTERKRTEYGRI